MTYDRVGVVRDGVVVLDDVTLQIPATGITAIVGPSGSGKSTLLRLANRLDVPTRGRIAYDGGPAGAQPDVLALRRRLGMVFQRPLVFAGSCLDNLRVADSSIGGTAAAELLRRCALDTALLDRDAAVLSGGEAQRLCFARALAAAPRALLADEATSSLDAEARDTVELLARTLADGGMPIVWVTHDTDQVRRLADRMVTMDAGRVTSFGPIGGAADAR